MSVETVEQEHELLQALCGNDAAKYPLEYLEPAPGYAFAFENGCRAPPWRQLHGDIAYFVCLPRDAQEGKELPITASREGWFLNQVCPARTQKLINNLLLFIYSNNNLLGSTGAHTRR